MRTDPITARVNSTLTTSDDDTEFNTIRSIAYRNISVPISVSIQVESLFFSANEFAQVV